MCFVEVDVDVDEAFKVFARLLDQELAVGSKDASVAVVDVVVLTLCTYQSETITISESEIRTSLPGGVCKSTPSAEIIWKGARVYEAVSMA